MAQVQETVVADSMASLGVACEDDVAKYSQVRETDSEAGSTEPGSDELCSDRDLDTDGRSGSFGSATEASLSSSNRGERALVLCDWDDTVFPTSWLCPRGLLDAGLLDNGIIALSEPDQAELKELERALITTFETVMQRADVVIVTNALEGWFEDSCLHFFPTLWTIVKSLKIVSARSEADRIGLPKMEPYMWKEIAFEREIAAVCCQSPPLGEEARVRTLISMGDSDFEHRALITSCAERDMVYAKTIRFAESPSVHTLLQEHELVAGGFSDILDYTGDLDVDIAC